MRQLFIDFEGKVVRFVNNEREVLVVKVLRSDGRATSVGSNRDFQLCYHKGV